MRKKASRLHPDEGEAGSPVGCERLIESWADSVLYLEKYRERASIVSEADPRFLALLGDSVYRIHRFNNHIIKLLEQKSARGLPFIDAATTGQRWASNEVPGPGKKIEHFCSFHNDLIVSRVKRFFFREEPNKAKTPPFFAADQEIYLLGHEILKLLDGKSTFDYRYVFLKYFYLLDLLYAFVYDDYTRRGVFLHFDYDYDLFKGLKEICQGGLEEVEDEPNFRKYVKLRLNDILSYYLREWGEPEEANRPIKAVYGDFVNAFAGNDEAFVEPLTWHLSDIICKVEGLVQDAFEFTDLAKKKEHDRKLVADIRNFISESLALYDKAYRDQEIPYDEIFEAEADFIWKVVSCRLLFLDEECEKGKERGESGYRTDRDRVLRVIDEISSLVGEQITLTFSDNPETLPGEPTGVSTGESLARNRKVETLLESSRFSDLLLMITGYLNLSKPFWGQKSDRALVGFYSSGAFLAHVTNLFGHARSQLTDPAHKRVSSLHLFPVWMFKAFPYIAIHPLHARVKDPDRVDIRKLIICDETVRTGFTYSIFEGYLANRMPKLNSVIILTLFEYLHYEKVETLRVPDLNSVCVISDHQRFDLPATDQVSPLPLPQFGVADRREFVSRLSRLIRLDGRYDLTFLLSNSLFLFFVCGELADAVKEKAAGKDVFIFSPSAGGRLLAMITAFLLRLRGVRVHFTFDPAANWYRILIDLAFVTGFTASYYWSVFQNLPAEKVRLGDGYPDDFDDRFTLDEYLKRNGAILVSMKEGAGGKHEG